MLFSNYVNVNNCDFGWNNVEILHSESNKGKREFMEMLCIKREGRYSLKFGNAFSKVRGCLEKDRNTNYFV